MHCTNCGNKLESNSTFCPECGVKIENKEIHISYNSTNKTNNNNGLKTASIVLGIVGLVLGIFLSVLGFIISLVGLILGLCALKKGKNVIGTVLNSVALAISIIVSVLVIIGVTSFLNIGNIINNQIPEYNYDFSSINLEVLYENDIPLENVINRIDKIILNEMFEDTDEMSREVKDNANSYYDMYEEYYGYSKEEFLNYYGFEDEEDFIEYLELDYKRNSYCEYYVRKLIKDSEINKYYEEEVFGDINSKHILVKLDSDYTESDRVNAENFAKQLINELNNDKTFDKIKEEYKDYITYEELGYRAFNYPLEEAYIKEIKELEVGSYSSKPIQTSYGYHIVYKIDQKEKPSLEEVRDDIIDILVGKKQSEDEYLYYKALINLREEAGFSFTGTPYEYQYEDYIKNYK